MTQEADAQPVDLGILFVHGIGQQGEADTLLAHGEPLIDRLDGWLTPVGTDRAGR